MRRTNKKIVFFRFRCRVLFLIVLKNTEFVQSPTRPKQEEKHLKNQCFTIKSILSARPSLSDRAKNQPICQGVARFFTICFGPDIDEKMKAKVSLFFGTTIASPSPSLLRTPRSGWQMRKNRL
jgi:hypothetical protein